MSDIERIKKAVKSDESLRKSFYGIKNAEEAIEIAHANGFNISKEELARDQELSEGMLAAVAGGKGEKKETYIDHSIKAVNYGNGSNIYIQSKDTTSVDNRSYN